MESGRTAITYGILIIYYCRDFYPRWRKNLNPTSCFYLADSNESIVRARYLTNTFDKSL